MVLADIEYLSGFADLFTAIVIVELLVIFLSKMFIFNSIFAKISGRHLHDVHGQQQLVPLLPAAPDPVRAAEQDVQPGLGHHGR